MNRTGLACADMERCPNELDDFDRIITQNQKRIFRTLLFFVRDHDEAENLTQECFLRAYRMREKFRGGCAATWLMRISINLAHDRNRNRRWEFWRRRAPADWIHAMDQADPRCSPEQAMIERQSLNAVWAAVDRLSERQRTVFLLRFVEEMPLEQIAEIMNLRPGTIKTHLHRATELVRKELRGIER